jgi:hypothetical protein
LPAGYKPLIFAKGKDGRFRVAVIAPGANEDVLGTLDGDSISSLTPIHAKWNLNFARGMLESLTGELWLGGTTGLWRLANGKYERVPPSPQLGNAQESEDPTKLQHPENSGLFFPEKTNGTELLRARFSFRIAWMEAIGAPTPRARSRCFIE